jgi:hypothetical protein
MSKIIYHAQRAKNWSHRAIGSVLTRPNARQISPHPPYVTAFPGYPANAKAFGGLTPSDRNCFHGGAMTPVQSSNLAAVGYGGGVLTIAFLSGSIYEYYHVPYSEYVGLMQAGSHGKYFHANIRNSYSYRKIYG